jgi:hypothetical protein
MTIRGGGGVSNQLFELLSRMVLTEDSLHYRA